MLNFLLTKPSVLAGILIASITLLLAACGAPAAPTPSPTEVPSAVEASATDTPVAEAATPANEPEEPAGSEAVPPPAQVSEGAASELEPAARADMYSAPPPMQIDPATIYYATLKTEQGDIKVQLFADRAPVTVNSFVFLAREGFYNNTTFHRVLDGFMAQGGDPTGTGAGGPGYRFQDEFDPSLTFDRAGLLAMANSGPGTNGSQFFITFAPTEWLNGGHTIFGEVVEGAEVLDRLTRRDPNTSPSFEGDLLYTVLIEESETSLLPTPLPPTPTPTPLPGGSRSGRAPPGGGRADSTRQLLQRCTRTGD